MGAGSDDDDDELDSDGALGEGDEEDDVHWAFGGPIDRSLFVNGTGGLARALSDTLGLRGFLVRNGGRFSMLADTNETARRARKERARILRRRRRQQQEAEEEAEAEADEGDDSDAEAEQQEQEQQEQQQGRKRKRREFEANDEEPAAAELSPAEDTAESKRLKPSKKQQHEAKQQQPSSSYRDPYRRY